MTEMGPAEARQRPTYLGGSALALLPLMAGIAGVALLAKGLYPVNLPSTRDPDFIDAVFDNRGVLWTARLLLVSLLAFGGFFIVISIGMRMKNGEWLRRAGPFEVSETTLSEVEEQRERWRIAALLEQNCIRIRIYGRRGALMTQVELNKQIERTLKRNNAAIQRARKRSGSLIRAAEKFDPAFDRALERLRQSVR